MFGCLGAWVLGCCAWAPGVPGRLGAWRARVHGCLACLGAWLPCCLGAWALGCLGAWAPGCLGAWALGVLGCLAAWVLVTCLGSWVPGA